MDIVFMGSPDFAIPSLEKIHASEHDVVAVVSNVDKRRGRGGGTSPTPVKARALELDLPVIGVDDLSLPAFTNKLAALKADLFVLVAFRILPPKILDIPRKGSINLHASLLPKYRGAAPIHWAIINGEEKTGCTVFFLNEKVDTGHIIKQKETAIGKNETTGDVYKRLKKMGSELLLEALDEIADDSYSTYQQDDSKATPAPKLFTDDCRIDFDKKALEVHNKIRGLSPFPTAWAKLDDLKFNMYRSELADASGLNLKSGELQMEDEELLVGCRDGAVVLKEVQIAGKRRMSGKDFMNGYSGIGVIH
ncbi:methionyl-tRNA formyltransferase [Aliifodinibius sp. S!AR15-10]|uniref:methionyl-tRNA formyltransferase n=1 Tax=Aliifodinibius sp. S!AR15-10 TaxID=2950437 RepID=UPI002864E002|nr:methionyl-tRNA formyltransferase [Aliifodinibius sp. S!AR15-10]MDR8392263.1 methionyl-tRNA formyltransferase [Aliifodinibius sp. S!AR15-10]